MVWTDPGRRSGREANVFGEDARGKDGHDLLYCITILSTLISSV